MPLFPLDIVVVPKERIPLHIFEPRYKRMIKDSIKTGDPFGIVLKENKGLKTIGSVSYTHLTLPTILLV